MKSLALLAALLLALPAHAALHLPTLPGDGQHVVDLAGLVTAEDAAEIQAIGQRLWAEQQMQLIVVSIDSMAEYGGARMSIEDFADALYRDWGVGGFSNQGSAENMGILLLLSRVDRKARIKLGAGWGISKDTESWDIMQTHLVPAFKREDYSMGLASGASALDSMARGLPIPSAPLSQEQKLGLGGGGVLLLWTIVSLILSGSQGYAWAFWSVVFGLIWTFLKLAFSVLSFFVTSGGRHHHHHHHGWGSSHDSSSSWGGSSSWSGGGDSSGGGSSGGGGGATGSW